MGLITIKAKEIKENIASGLSKCFFTDGFVYAKSSNEFKLKREDFTYIYNIEQLTWSDHLTLNVNLWITQKKVELILESAIGKTRHKITLGDDIGRIYKGFDGKKTKNKNLTILLFQNEDIESAVETLERYYIEIAKPYFIQYNSLKAIDELINNPPFDHSPADVGGNFDDRCMKGLIFARLVNNPRYEELVSIYDEAIKETMSSESVDNYHRVREYLKYNRIE